MTQPTANSCYCQYNEKKNGNMSDFWGWDITFLLGVVMVGLAVYFTEGYVSGFTKAIVCIAIAASLLIVAVWPATRGHRSVYINEPWVTAFFLWVVSVFLYLLASLYLLLTR